MDNENSVDRSKAKTPVASGQSPRTSPVNDRSQTLRPNTQKSTTRSTGSILLYVGATVAGIALGGALVFTSDAPKEQWRPPTTDDAVALTPTVMEQPAPKLELPPPKEVAPPFRADGVINVPSAGLRTAPSFDAKAVPGNVRQGEGVIITKRQSAGGPEWLQVKTKSGKSGWVLASVVNERKRK
jgi:hypothetical protein